MTDSDTPRRSLKGPVFLTLIGLLVIAALAVLPFWAGPPPEEGLPDMAKFIGRFHPVLLHLPIGMLLLVLALETGRIKAETVLNTAAGSVVVSGIPIKDAHGHAALSAREVIQKSSNIGIVRIAMMMPPRELWELYSAVGYGQKPQISFPGAVTGRLRPYKTWRPIEQATMAYGYGLSASLLQMAQAYTVFARDGEVVPVSMLKQDHPVTGRRRSPTVGVRGAKPYTGSSSQAAR